MQPAIVGGRAHAAADVRQAPYLSPTVAVEAVDVGLVGARIRAAGGEQGVVQHRAPHELEHGRHGRHLGPRIPNVHADLAGGIVEIGIRHRRGAPHRGIDHHRDRSAGSRKRLHPHPVDALTGDGGRGHAVERHVGDVRPAAHHAVRKDHEIAPVPRAVVGNCGESPLAQGPRPFQRSPGHRVRGPDPIVVGTQRLRPRVVESQTLRRAHPDGVVGGSVRAAPDFVALRIIAGRPRHDDAVVVFHLRGRDVGRRPERPSRVELVLAVLGPGGPLQRASRPFQAVELVVVVGTDVDRSVQSDRGRGLNAPLQSPGLVGRPVGMEGIEVGAGVASDIDRSVRAQCQRGIYGAARHPHVLRRAVRGETVHITRQIAHIDDPVGADRRRAVIHVADGRPDPLGGAIWMEGVEQVIAVGSNVNESVRSDRRRRMRPSRYRPDALRRPILVEKIQFFTRSHDYDVVVRRQHGGGGDAPGVGANLPGPVRGAVRIERVEGMVGGLSADHVDRAVARNGAKLDNPARDRPNVLRGAVRIESVELVGFASDVDCPVRPDGRRGEASVRHRPDLLRRPVRVQRPQTWRVGVLARHVDGSVGSDGRRGEHRPLSLPDLAGDAPRPGLRLQRHGRYQEADQTTHVESANCLHIGSSPRPLSNITPAGRFGSSPRLHRADCRRRLFPPWTGSTAGRG